MRLPRTASSTRTAWSSANIARAAGGTSHIGKRSKTSMEVWTYGGVEEKYAVFHASILQFFHTGLAQGCSTVGQCARLQSGRSRVRILPPLPVRGAYCVFRDLRPHSTQHAIRTTQHAAELRALMALGQQSKLKKPAVTTAESPQAPLGKGSNFLREVIVELKKTTSRTPLHRSVGCARTGPSSSVQALLRCLRIPARPR